jgi:hypothetical protein
MSLTLIPGQWRTRLIEPSGFCDASFFLQHHYTFDTKHAQVLYNFFTLTKLSVLCTLTIVYAEAQ